MALFETGKQFPPQKDIERIAKYQKGERIYKGKDLQDLYNRAQALLKESKHAPQLRKLYTAVNVVQMLSQKPADLLVGEPPVFESGQSGASQDAVNRLAEENDLTSLLHDIGTSGAFRGDMWLKVRYGYRQDFSELLAFGGKIPDTVPMESIIEAVNPNYVFPEESGKNAKSFKAVNVAYVQYEDELGIADPYNPFDLRDEALEKNNVQLITTGRTPYLYVERHIPGYIFFHKFQLNEFDLNMDYGIQIPVYKIGELVDTGRQAENKKNIVETGVPMPLLFHAPYSAIDTEWQGMSLVEVISDLLSAINDRITQISYILWKHCDPTAYGPDLSNANGTAGTPWGGKYIPLDKDDPKPGYMVWEAQLDSAFRELDTLLGLVFMKAETPQWLFGTVLTADTGGSGTSHSDGSAIRARFMPITSKVNRIRLHLDKTVRDALYAAQLLEIKANEHVKGFETYEAVYPKVTWKDGIPKDEKEEAEIMAIRTNGATTLDTLSAIKRSDNLNDDQAQEIIDRIEEEKKARQEEALAATPDVFNELPAEEPTAQDSNSSGSDEKTN